MKKFVKGLLIFILLTLNLIITSCGLPEKKVENAYQALIKLINFDYVVDDLYLPIEIDDVLISYNSYNKEILSDDGKITQSETDQNVELEVIFELDDHKFIKIIEVTIIKEFSEFNEPFLPKDLILLEEMLIQERIGIGLKTEGEVKALIIPIDFVDYRFNNNQIERLDKAFFGTEQDTGWESVKTYYKKSSYDKLSFSGTITEVYQSSKKSSFYTALYNNGEDADYVLIKEALEYLDPKINFADYDLNKDGYIDALYFIYSTPVYYGGSHFFDKNQSDLWWAYVYQYYTDEIELYDGVEAYYYLWAGYDFMDEAFTEEGFTDQQININAATYIHETGHMLGLEDYYDYDDSVGPKGGLGGADMMDYTVGDHTSFSKIMMGWTTPYVASNENFEIKIRPFESSGDVILVTNDWKDSFFDEYFLIDYYTPTGLNEGHAGYWGLFSISGIRIYHVNSVVDPEVGKQKNEDGYFSVFSFNNSDTKNRLISLIEADGNNSIPRTHFADDDDLFQVGQVFGGNVHSNYRFHNKEQINFKIHIVSITPQEATIRIIFN